MNGKTEQELRQDEKLGPEAPEEEIELEAREAAEVERRTAPPVTVVHEAIRAEGEAELLRPVSALAFSGLAAGLSMGFSLVAEGLLRAEIGEVPWVALVSKLGYSVGFLIVILGRQQLFTENTLTPILPLLQRRSLRTLVRVLRMWSVVLLTNILGALLFAWAVARSDVFDAHTREVFARIGHEAMGTGFGNTFLRAIFAGWLIALMVWLLPYAESARFWVIIVLTYLVGIGHFSHIIAGSTETLFIVVLGQAAVADFFLRFFLPTLLGNVVGGVALVTAINHAQTVAGKETARSE
ncbi:MAG TPA: formate/nitrite transporter family protein [Longimicrobiaceae bacterium]|nr:formate/nitrite transporter family protein [Longimicrobiaceae bacterium]